MMDRPAHRHIAPRLLLLAILLLAAALRLTRLDLAEFKRDEATIVRRALDIVHAREFPAVGVASSQGPDNPPLTLYLTALPLAVAQDPRLAVALVATLNLGAVLATYLLAKRFFDPRMARVAAWLFAVSPWAVFYGRKIWAQNLPLVTLGFVGALFFLVVEHRPWALAGAFLALAALIGLHLGGLAFLFVLALTLLLFPSRIRRWPLLCGCLVLILLFLPYLYHDARTGWSNLQAFRDMGGQPAQIGSDALRYAAWISSGYHYQDLAGTHYQTLAGNLVNLAWLDVVEMILLGAGTVYLLLKIGWLAKKRWHHAAPRYVLLLAWLVIPIALQTRHTQAVYPHYFILLYPVQHLIIAVFLIDALDWVRARWEVRGLSGILVLFLIALGGWQVYLGQSFLTFAAQHDTVGGYGPTLGPSRRAASAAIDGASEGAEILIVAQGDKPAWDNMPAVFEALLPRHLPHRFVDGQKALVFPLRPTVYVLAPGVDEAWATLAHQTGTQQVLQIDAPGEKLFFVFRRSNESRDDVLAGMTSLDPPRRLANGVELLAYQIGSPEHSTGLAPKALADTVGEYRPGETIHLSLAWWLDGPPPVGIDYHAFAHLVDADGGRWGQHDLSGFPSASWQTGDLVLTRFQIATDAKTPPGEYWIRLGMYSYPDVVNVPILDAAGNPASGFTVAGPVSLH